MTLSTPEINHFYIALIVDFTIVLKLRIQLKLNPK